MQVRLNNVSVMPHSLVSVGRSSSDVLWMANYYGWSNLTRPIGQVAAKFILGLLYSCIIPPGITVAVARNCSPQRFFPSWGGY